jgi:hypothetical protein
MHDILDVNDKPTGIKLAADAKLVENSAENVFISKVEMVDEDRDTKASCKLLDTSDDRVSYNNDALALLVGGTMTDYESLDSSKELEIVIECQDEHGASVTSTLRLPVEGNCGWLWHSGYMKMNMVTVDELCFFFL